MWTQTTTLTYPFCLDCTPDIRFSLHFIQSFYHFKAWNFSINGIKCFLKINKTPMQSACLCLQIFINTYFNYRNIIYCSSSCSKCCLQTRSVFYDILTSLLIYKHSFLNIFSSKLVIMKSLYSSQALASLPLMNWLY